MPSANDRSRAIRWIVAAALLSSCAAAADAAPRPAAAGVCPLRPAYPSQIDVFDGEPSEQVLLAPDDNGAGANTYTVKDVYAQGRMVTIRCHYGQASVDVKLAKPVAACRYSGDDKHPQIACR